MDIACITESPHLGTQVEDALGELCGRFTSYRSGTALARCQDHQNHDVILLANTADLADTVLSCRAAASKGAGPVVILLSGEDCGLNVDRALASGVDDYISLAGGLSQLATRIRVCTARRQRKPDRHVLAVHNVVLDRRDCSARVDGVATDLTGREFLLAWVLFSNAGAIVSVRTLAEVVWGTTAEIAKRTIEQHIYRLRGKLRLKSPGRLSLAAVYGRGYRLDEVRTAGEAGNAVGPIHRLPPPGGTAWPG
jgi:DNA-binding response OmpR family regulator